MVRAPQLPSSAPAVRGGGRVLAMYDPADVELPIAPVERQSPPHSRSSRSVFAASAAPTDEDHMRRLRAQYYGMISEVDFHWVASSRPSRSEASGTTRWS